ncbi:unnamed protein product, partial [Effrenium voratum]
IIKPTLTGRFGDSQAGPAATQHVRLQHPGQYAWWAHAFWKIEEGAAEDVQRSDAKTARRPAAQQVPPSLPHQPAKLFALE